MWSGPNVRRIAASVFQQGCSNRVPLTPITRPFRDSSECRNRYVCGPNQGAHYADRHSGYEQKSRQHCYSTAGGIFILPPRHRPLSRSLPGNDYGCFSIWLQLDATRRRALLSKRLRERERKHWNEQTRKKWDQQGFSQRLHLSLPHEAQKTVLDQTEYSHDINWMG